MGRRLAVVVAAAVSLTALMPAAHARPIASSNSVRLAPGVRLIHSAFTLHAGSKSLPEHVVTLQIALSAATTLVAASPKDVIGAPRATVLAMARQEHAIAGINGDFFYFDDPTAVPRGGITHLGHLIKSALVDKKAALYVTSAGVAAIGDPGFAGTVATDNGHSYKIRSANSLENAKNGGLTIADRNVLAADLPGCTVARLRATSTSEQYELTSIRGGVTHFARAAVGARALVTCGAGERWMRANLVVGHDVTASAGYAVRSVRTLLSGGRVLVRGGKRFNDKDGLLGYGNQRKPESFACVRKGGHTVLLGTVEGDQKGSAGMTYAQLTSYLLRQRCWSAMTLDGSGSSTLVAKRPNHQLAVENHPTNKGGPRRVVDGLFVVRT